MSCSPKDLCRRFAPRKITRACIRIPRNWRARVGHYLSVGAWGERVARRYLRTRGISILKTNWRSARLEADIIARDRATLVVVEVKTRHRSLKEHFPGRLSITEEKRENLKSLLRRFVRNNGPFLRRFGISRYRIDTIEVYYSTLVNPIKITTTVEWVPGVSLPKPDA